MISSLLQAKRALAIYNSDASQKLGEYDPDHSEVTALKFSSDGSFLISGGKGGDVTIFDLESESITRAIDAHKGEVLDITTDSKSKLLITTGRDKAVKVWEISSGDLSKELDQHKGYILSVDVSTDDILAYGGSENTLYTYDLKSGSHGLSEQLEVNWIRTLDWSHSGNRIALGSDNGNVLILGILGGQIVETKTLNDGGRINALAFSHDEKYLAAGNASARLHIWELENGREVYNNKQAKAIQDVDFDPRGKYLSVVNFSDPTVHLYDVSSFGIASIIKFIDEDDTTPPQIYISNPPNIQGDIVRYSKDLIDIKGTVIDDSGLRSLMINGMKAPLQSNGNFIIKMPLAMGENYVSIEATDVNDNIALKKFVIQRRDLNGEAYSGAKAKNYLLIVGIDNYQHWPALNNAVRDANDVASTLIGKYNFDFSNVTLITNDQATRANIYNTLRGFIEKVTPQDNLMIYYSGHGYFDELLNEGYWVPVEAQQGSDSEYLSNTAMLKILENVNSQHTFIVADACFSGSLFADRSRGYAENVERYKSRWGLASGRLETVSDGAYGENSPFADSFIEFLKTNDKDKVAVSELVQYVKLNVAETANQTPIGNPLKSLGDEGGEFVFYKK